MDSRYIEHSFINEKSIEERKYQVNIVKDTINQNSLVVLPTGLGKTVIAALHIANVLEKNSDKNCIILAPTRVLVNQHYNFLLDKMNVSEDEVKFITGEDFYEERIEKWKGKIICSTPQILKLDIKREIVDISNFGLVIFDEVHRAIGEYAYTFIAEELGKIKENRVIGMTASLPSEKKKVNEIIDCLRIKHIEYRDQSSEDVIPYIQKTEIEWIEVEMSQSIKKISDLIRKAIEERQKKLRTSGLKIPSKASLKFMIDLSKRLEVDIRYKNRWDIKTSIYSSIRLFHGLNLIETQGVNSFIEYVKRLEEKTKSSGARKLLADKNFKEACEIARGCLLSNQKHPKIEMLNNSLDSLKQNEKAIVFASYRDSVDEIYENLISKGYKTGVLIGKSGVKGQSQKEQITSLEKLKTGEYDIIVATQVGEEGLDVSECKLVVFYDNVSSAIRYIQRIGRTGRRSPGRMIGLITKGTRDEANKYLIKKRLDQAKRTIESVNKSFEDKNTREIDSYFE